MSRMSCLSRCLWGPAKRRPSVCCSRYQLILIQSSPIIKTTKGARQPSSSCLRPPQLDSQVLLAYCSYDEAQFLFRQAAEVGLVGPGYVWIIPSLAVGNPNSPPPDSFPVGVIGVITDQWRKSLRQRVREGVAIVAKGAESFKRQQGFVPEGHGDCSKPAKHADNNTLFR